MANKKISALTASGASLADGVVLPIVESGTTKKATRERFLNVVVPTLDGATNTFGVTHAHKLVRATHSASVTLTVPPNSSVPYDVGTRIGVIADTSSGQVIIAAGAGVTIRSAAATLKLRQRYSEAELVKIDTDEWLLRGDLEDTAAAEIKAVSQLSGLPYSISQDPTFGLAALSLTFGPALAGDVFILDFYAEVFNENASPRDLNARFTIDGANVQDSSAIEFAATGDPGSIQCFVMKIAIPLADDSSAPVFDIRLAASGADMKASQLCLTVTKLGQ